MSDRTFRIVRVIDGHPLRAAREHDGFDPRPLVEDLGGDLGVMVVHAIDARDHAGLGGVGRHHRCARVARDIAGLGVDDHGNIVRPRDFDDPPDEDRNEHAFGVVGQHNRGNLVDRLVQPAANRVDVVLAEMKAALDVEPHDLVAAGNVTNLCRGRMAVRPDKPAHNSVGLRQRTGDQVAPLVIANGADKDRLAAEGDHVARNIGGAAQHGLFRLVLKDRDGRFRRDPVDLSVDELVEHHVADDENFRAAPLGYPRRVSHLNDVQWLTVVCSMPAAVTQ